MDKKHAVYILDERSVDLNPFNQFSIWFEDIIRAGVEEPAAMFLATAGTDGKPSGRVVLLKDFNEKGFVFYSNYNSRKGMEIYENPYVALTFHWKEFERQVRITGEARKLTRKESDTYFKTRPFESRVSAIISPQSSVIPGREFLERQKAVFMTSNEGKEVKRPSYWGGYIIKPAQFEFWQGRESRLHDRIQFRLVKNSWIIERLAP